MMFNLKNKVNNNYWNLIMNIFKKYALTTSCLLFCINAYSFNLKWIDAPLSQKISNNEKNEIKDHVTSYMQNYIDKENVNYFGFGIKGLVKSIHYYSKNHNKVYFVKLQGKKDDKTIIVYVTGVIKSKEVYKKMQDIFSGIKSKQPLSRKSL